MEIKLLLREKDRQIIAKNFRTGTLLAQGGAPRGQSAYEQAVEGGYTGTKEEFEAALAFNISAISENIEDVATVADAIEDVEAVAADLTDVHTVAENITDVKAVAADISKVNTVAGISSDISQVAGISSAVSTVSAHDSDVTLVSDNMASVMTTASNISNVNNVAGNATNINTVAGISSDVSTVSANATAIATAATNMAAIIAAPTAAQNAATSATNAQTWAEGTDAQVAILGGTKSSKGWAERAEEIVETIGQVMHYKGSVATYADLQNISDAELGDVYNVQADDSNYAWAGTAWDKIGSSVDLSAYRTAAQQDVIDGNLSTAITNHTSNTSNPHSVTKAQVGLGNVDNTSDLNKPISTATQTALNAKQDTLVSGTNIKTVNGNSLLGSGNVDIDALPSQTGQSGKFLTTNGTTASWDEVNIPSNTWTQDNLVAGENITITKQPNPYVINEDTLAIFHLDGNFNNGIDNSNFSIVDEAVAAGYESSFLTGSDKKFGTAASNRVYDNGTWYYRNLSINAYKQFPNGFTIDFWAKAIYSPEIMTSGIIPGGYGLYVNGFGVVGFGAGSYSEPFYATSWNVNVDKTNWHHIAISISPTKRRFFLDGVLVVSADFSGSLELSANATSKFGQVIIDELRITNKALWQDTDDFSADLPDAPYDAGEDVYQINSTGGASKNIGEVYYSQSSSAQDNAGALPLFTGETISNADQVYPDFYAWVANHAGLQISAADYETAITTYGECPKYVIDTTNKTIRLPLLKNYVKMANTTDGITQSDAGLPNITGSTNAANIGNNYGTTGGNGAIKNSAYPTGDTGVRDGSGNYGNVIEFDASWSNSIYGNSNTVTPAHTTLYPWVCAYNAAVPASTAQAAQFQQALTGKADTNLSNVTGTSGFRKLVEVYNNGASWYKVFDEYDPTTGTFIGKWCEQGGNVVFPNYATTVYLSKTYKDTNYSLLLTPWGWPQNPSEWIAGGAKYTDSFVIRSTTPYDMTTIWRTAGYLAIQ